MFSDHTAMKLEINHKKNTEKHTETWKLNNMLSNNEWINNEIKEELKNTWKQIKMRTRESKLCGTRGQQS